MSNLSVADFHLKVDAIYRKLELVLEQHLDVVDIVVESGIFKIISETNGLQAILTKQVAVRELWLALPDKGLHFFYSNQQWQTRDNQQLSQVLQQAFAEIFHLEINIAQLY